MYSIKLKNGSELHAFDDVDDIFFYDGPKLSVSLLHKAILAWNDSQPEFEVWAVVDCSKNEKQLLQYLSNEIGLSELFSLCSINIYRRLYRQYDVFIYIDEQAHAYEEAAHGFHRMNSFIGYNFYENITREPKGTDSISFPVGADEFAPIVTTIPWIACDSAVLEYNYTIYKVKNATKHLLLSPITFQQDTSFTVSINSFSGTAAGKKVSYDEAA